MSHSHAWLVNIFNTTHTYAALYCIYRHSPKLNNVRSRCTQHSTHSWLHTSNAIDVATRLAWESLCTFTFVYVMHMHAHYDVLLCISAHHNKKNWLYGYGLLILHKEDERAELRTEDWKLKTEENLVLVVIIKMEKAADGRRGSACSKWFLYGNKYASTTCFVVWKVRGR